jgi:hypothetical protein
VPTHADKGNTLVIMHQDEYNAKINEFITNNNFTKVFKDHTKIQQRAIKETINTCSNIIKHEDKWRYVNMNPDTPQIVGTIKLHKENKSIRPIVNWKSSSGYKLAIHIAKLLKDNLHLPNAFNIPNSKELTHNLKRINVKTSTKLFSFDITNMYINIPQDELIKIINNALEYNNFPRNKKQELITLVNTILNQNYIQHMDQQYKQNKGLAMGAPTSAILAEVFMQHQEHNYISKILQKQDVIDYYRYVDDMLIVYDDDHTNIDNMLKEFNSTHPNIQYTIEKQTNNTLNYLDISIENTHCNFIFSINRKPTTTYFYYG